MTSMLKTVALLCICAACHKEPHIRYGFDTEVGHHSQGLVVLRADKGHRTLRLDGHLILKEGSLLVELINPLGTRSFSKQFSGTETWKIHETKEAFAGNWKLKYSCTDGEGKLVLHLYIND